MLEINALSKQFDGAPALAGIDFSVEAGEIVAILGTSGAGKSTLLRIVGGLDTASSGAVNLDGRAVIGPSPKLGFVFQEPRLMPWLSVKQNVTFGLDGLSREERRERAETALERVGLGDCADALPRQLSGGMAQRVAIARALVTRPSVLLLDEPFSALDAFTRLGLQEHLLEIWRAERPTMLFVTHDIDEALVIADRIIVLLGRPGQIRRDERIDVARPRRRGDPRLARWRERLFDDLSGAPARSRAGRRQRKVAHMDSTQLRNLQAPLKDKYRTDPDAAVITLKARGDLADGVIACKVETGRALVEAGLHPATGGSGLEACSGDMLLEALVACAGVTLKAVATAIDFKLRGGSVHAEGDLDFRGTLGVDRTAPVGFRDIRLTFTLDTDEPEDRRANLLKLTERYCVVLQTLRNSPTTEAAILAD